MLEDPGEVELHPHQLTALRLGSKVEAQPVCADIRVG